MKLQCNWKDKMQFSAQAGELSVAMDAKPPIGNGSALTPKELLLAGLCGCTGMDVVAILKKYKQPLLSLAVESDAIPLEGSHPAVFREINLIFEIHGPMDREKVLEAVKLSQTKFCSVSGMLSKAVPINYQVRLNSETIGSGKADFT